MKNMRWLWLALASSLGGCTCLALCVAAFFALPLLKELSSKQAIAPGLPAPDFNLPGLAGGDIWLSDYAGAPVLITIGATW